MNNDLGNVYEQEKKTILVVDDEESIVDLLEFNLKKEGYDVLKAYDGISAVSIAINKKPDLMLLDVMIPRLDGISVCKKIRYYSDLSNMPILMVSAKDTESDKIVGLELGADDYITKPFQVRELMARVKANLRKSDMKNRPSNNTEISYPQNVEKEEPVSTESDSNTVQIGDLELNTGKMEARVKGKIVSLTKKEFDVLAYLASREGFIVSREELLKNVWEYDEFVGDIRIIDVTMNRIREKIEPDKGDPKVLVTKRGMGYYLRNSKR